MERVNEIIKNKEFNDRLYDIRKAEKGRVFCLHNMNHFLDVARIAALICEDENIRIDRELIYAAALLHDIGRAVQYREGVPHEEASADIAKYILLDCRFTRSETAVIIDAIAQHGNEEVKTQKNLTGVIYRADKLSRKCFSCSAINECHKSIDKKNMWVFY